jgi:tRNA dimethylallyltransferase
MAVYRRMDVGTATPTMGERCGIPHHLLDFLEPWEDCTVSLFQTRALEAMEGIERRGRTALLVGGTGLYHRAVIDRLAIPGQYPEVRAALEEEAGTPYGPRRLRERLVALDPIAESRIEAGNIRRLVRALEVCEGAGVPFSSFGPGLEAYPESPVRQVGLLPDVEGVLESVERRISEWMEGGLLEEVLLLREDPRGISRTAGQAIGYREMLDHLDGACSLDEAVSGMVRRTRALVRRQIAWFRRDPRVHWTSSVDEVAALLDDALAQARRSAQVRD